MSNIQNQLNLNASPFAHYRVEDLDQSVGQYITSWNDVSGNNRHMQSTTHNTRTYNSLTNSGPVLVESDKLTASGPAKAVHFTLDKMYHQLSSEIDYEKLDVYMVVDRSVNVTVGAVVGFDNTETQTTNHIAMGLLSSGGLNTWDNTGGSRLVTTSPKDVGHYSIHRSTITTNTMSVQDCLHPVDSTPNVIARTYTPGVTGDVMLLGSYISTNGSSVAMSSTYVMEVIIFRDSLNTTSHAALVEHLTNKYNLINSQQVPATGNCVRLSGELGAHIRYDESVNVAPSISTQKNRRDYNSYGSWMDNKDPSVLYDMWFKPEYVEDNGGYRYEMIFGVSDRRDTYLNTYLYLDHDQAETNSVIRLKGDTTTHSTFPFTNNDNPYNKWNRFSIVQSGEQHGVMHYYLNGTRTLTTTSGHQRKLNLDHDAMCLYIGQPDYQVTNFTSFRGKFLGLRKSRGELQDMIDLAEEYDGSTSFNTTSTSNNIIPLEKIGYHPIARKMFNYSSLPKLLNNQVQPMPLGTSSGFNMSKGYNRWNPDLTGLENSINPYTKIDCSYNRYTNLAAFVDCIQPNSSYSTASTINFDYGRIETLSHLRGSNFNKHLDLYTFQAKYNRLTDLDGVQDMKNIRNFYVGFNMITDISAFAQIEPDCWQNLVVLQLQNNQIQSIPPGTFSKFGPSLKTVTLQGNPLSTIDNLHECPGIRSLDISSTYYTGSASINDLSYMSDLRFLTMVNTPNVVTIPDVSGTIIEFINIHSNPDLQDISAFADCIKSTKINYTTTISTTDALYERFQAYNLPVLENPLITKANAGGRITVVGRIDISRTQLNDLTIFQNSLQDDNYIYKTNHTLSKFNVPYTPVTDTVNSLGIMKNFKYCAYINLQNCTDFTTLHQHALPSNPAISRSTAYTNYFGKYTYLDSSEISDLTFLVNPQMAGCQYLYLNYTPIDYDAVNAIKNQLIALKNSGDSRLIYISLVGSTWDTKQNDGTYTVCNGTTPSPQLQLKTDLWNVGIKLKFSSLQSGNSLRLGSNTQLPTCPILSLSEQTMDSSISSTEQFNTITQRESITSGEQHIYTLADHTHVQQIKWSYKVSCDIYTCQLHAHVPSTDEWLLIHDGAGNTSTDTTCLSHDVSQVVDKIKISFTSPLPDARMTIDNIQTQESKHI